MTTKHNTQLLQDGVRCVAANRDYVILESVRTPPEPFAQVLLLVIPHTAKGARKKVRFRLCWSIGKQRFIAGPVLDALMTDWPALARRVISTLQKAFPAAEEAQCRRHENSKRKQG